jgi:ubiquinone/menaquinone biosynthesis C-methylase UbiE
MDKRSAPAETAAVMGHTTVAMPIRQTTKEKPLDHPHTEHSAPQEPLVATYNLVAAGYDTQRHVQVRASRLVELVGLPRGAKVLDVATGTGWAALAAAQAVGAAGQVVGVDISPGMLEQARRKAAMAGLTHVEFREGDAQQLDFAPHSFDAVLCALALFFLPDMLAAVREWQRVTTPGGRVAFSTSGDTLFHPMGTMFNARLARYGVLLPSPQRLRDPAQCRNLLHEAGFADIAVYTEQLGYYLRDVDAYWEDTVAWNGSRGGAPLPASPRAARAVQSRPSGRGERTRDRPRDLGGRPMQYRTRAQAIRGSAEA